MKINKFIILASIFIAFFSLPSFIKAEEPQASPLFKQPAPVLKPIPEAKKLLPEKDTFVDSAYPQTNFGLEKILTAAFLDSSKIIFMQFDFENVSLNDFSGNNKAILNLYLEESSGEDENLSLEILLPNTNWQEKELTWNEKPSLYSSETQIILNNKKGWQKIDITPLVKKWLTEEENNCGFALYTHSNLFSRTYSSRENEQFSPYISFEPFESPLVKVSSLKSKIEENNSSQFREKQASVAAALTKENETFFNQTEQQKINWQKLISANNLLPLTTLWSSAVFFLLLGIIKEHPS